MPWLHKLQQTNTVALLETGSFSQQTEHASFVYKARQINFFSPFRCSLAWDTATALGTLPFFYSSLIKESCFQHPGWGFCPLREQVGGIVLFPDKPSDRSCRAIGRLQARMVRGGNYFMERAASWVKTLTFQAAFLLKRSIRSHGWSPKKKLQYRCCWLIRQQG